MTARRKGRLLLLALLALVALVLATRGPATTTPTPRGSFSFAALGDAPYYLWEEIQYRLVLSELDAADVRFVLHVGDIFWHPCTDAMYRRTLDWFNALPHPVIYTPGDNEWTDCWERGSGGFSPRDRLDRIRRIFFDHPTRSLGGRPLALASQAGEEPFAEFVENARWAEEGLVFATMNLVGSMNGTAPFEGRSRADDAAVKRRTEAAAAWVRETFLEAVSRHAAAVVISFHANPGFEELVGDSERQTYEPFLSTLEEEVERFHHPVLAVHGDGHVYTLDHPLVRRTTGRLLANFTRLQVPGSPKVGWVRVVVTPGASEPFAFEERVVPRWKYW